MAECSYAECRLCWVSFMLSVNYAECPLCWVSQIIPLCWVSLCWMSSSSVSLCWVSWRRCAKYRQKSHYAEWGYVGCSCTECHGFVVMAISLASIRFYRPRNKSLRFLRYKLRKTSACIEFVDPPPASIRSLTGINYLQKIAFMI
jgi:hypothetical protein